MRSVLRPAAVLVAVGAAAAFVAAVDPNQAGHYPTCPFLFVTGWYCPGCGSLRAVNALAHGDAATAFARNPLLVLSLAVLAVIWARWARRSWLGSARTTAAPSWVGWTFLGVVCAFWVLRNLPGFTWLAP